MQYIVGILAGGITAAGLFLLQQFPIWWVLLLVFFVLSGVLFVIFWYVKHIVEWHWNVLFTAIFTLFSGIALVTIVDTLVVRKWLILFVGVSIGLVYGWGIAERLGAFYTSRTFRRYAMMVIVFDAYALMTFLFALSSFFVRSHFFLTAVIGGGVLFGMLSVHIWRMYFQVDRQSLIIWGGIVGLACVQLVWVIHLLPFAYAVLGLFMTWVWYLMQLFVRFHLGERGIIWRKQAIFLGTNAALYAAVLFFFVRWT